MCPLWPLHLCDERDCMLLVDASCYHSVCMTHLPPPPPPAVTGPPGYHLQGVRLQVHQVQESHQWNRDHLWWGRWVLCVHYVQEKPANPTLWSIKYVHVPLQKSSDGCSPYSIVYNDGWTDYWGSTVHTYILSYSFLSKSMYSNFQISENPLYTAC